MVLTGLLFVAFNASVKIFGQGLPAAQSAFIRFAVGAIFVAPLLPRILRDGLPHGSLPLFGLRAVLHIVGVVLWFYAMTRIPIAEVTAINFLNPVAATLGAVLFLREPLSPPRAVAILVALGGALLILRPGMRGLDLGHLAQVTSSVLVGLSYLVARNLAQKIPAEVVVAVMTLTVTAGLLPFALAVWQPMGWGQLAGLTLVALIATLGHYAMTRAFAVAPMAVTQPVTFLQLIWASLMGVAVFHEPLDPMVLLGGAIIIAAISFITWRETRVAQRMVQ